MSVMLASWLIFQAMAHDQPQVEVKLVRTVKLAVIFFALLHLYKATAQQQPCLILTHLQFSRVRLFSLGVCHYRGGVVWLSAPGSTPLDQLF